jgi:hypothetical protein
MKIFDSLEQSGRKSVNIPNDYYWSVPASARYDPYSEPKELTLGQISMDLEELERILLSEKHDPPQNQ